MSAVLERRSVQAPPAASLAELVNQLTRELSEARRLLTAASQRLSSTTRSLDVRSQDLTEARAAVTLLLATLDSTSDGILAIGHFGRAMHFNSRFIEIWGIPGDKLSVLTEGALLGLQLAAIRDPAPFLQWQAARKAEPDGSHSCLAELHDGRILECRALPQRIAGRRVGLVTSYRDVTQAQRLDRLVSAMEDQWPDQVARARAISG